MDDEDVGVGGQALPPGELGEVKIDREIEAALERRALLKAAGWIAECFVDIGRGEFYAETLVWIGQQAERAFGDRAFARIGVGRLVFIAFLGQRGGRTQAYEDAGPNPDCNWSPSLHGGFNR